MDNRSLSRKKEKKRREKKWARAYEGGGVGRACSDEGKGRKRRETHNYLIRHLAFGSDGQK